MNSTTYLYFHSFSGEPNQLLLASILHYYYFSSDYLLVTNIEKSVLYRFLPKDINIIHPNEVESDLTRHISTLLCKNWDNASIFANHPATEIHCFRRWLILNDLYKLKLLDNNRLVFSHDWDDLIFLKLESLISNIPSHFFVNQNKGFVVANHPHPVKAEMAPHFILVNRLAISNYVSSLEHLCNSFIFHKRQNFFSDMVPWANLYHKYIHLNYGSAFLWRQLFENIYFDDNLRVLETAGYPVFSRAFVIPDNFNCMNNTNLLNVKYFSSATDGNVYLHTRGSLLRTVDIHYSGTEGKFIMLQDLQCMLQPFYEFHVELKSNVSKLIL